MKKNNYLSLGGLFIALHLLFIFMSKLLVGSELILVIFLPLLSTIYASKFDKKRVAMFIIATFLLCVIFEPISTFIYVVPALICGTLYGELRKKEVKELSLIYISSLAHSLSLLIAFLAISFMFKEVDFFSIFATVIDKEGMSFYVCVYLILILIGVLEAFVTHIISNNELKKLGYRELDMEETTPLWMCIGFIISLIIYFVLAFIDPILSCYVFPFLLSFTIPQIVEFVSRGERKWLYFSLIVTFIAGLFLLGVVSKIFYPIIVLGVFLPLIVENFSRVLYTKLLKYSKEGKNNIK